MISTEVLVAFLIIGVLFVVVIAIFLRRIFFAKSDSLFGSVTKNVPKSSIKTKLVPFATSQLMHIQPTVSNDKDSMMGSVTCDQSDKGLSSIQSRWSSQDKGSEHSDDESSSNLIWKLWFKVEYTSQTDILEVTVFRAKCTPERYMENLRTSVTVTIYLLPDDISAQTAYYTNTGSPSFDESFRFLVPSIDFPAKLIRLSLYELDSNRTRICLGHTVIRINDHISHSGGIVYLYKDLEQLASALEEPTPEVHVSLMYNIPKEKLKIQIFAAKNLPETPAGYKYFLRTNVILGSKTAKTKKTEEYLALADIFLCSYNFGIPVRAMDTCCLQFSVMEVLPEGHERLYARLSIGSCMYAHGSGLDHWKGMMANTKKFIEMWHKLRLIEDEDRIDE